MLTEAKYNEEVEILKKCKVQEDAAGSSKFESIYGDVDNRDNSLLDITLSNGFKDV